MIDIDCTQVCMSYCCRYSDACMSAHIAPSHGPVYQCTFLYLMTESVSESMTPVLAAVVEGFQAAQLRPASALGLPGLGSNCSGQPFCCAICSDIPVLRQNARNGEITSPTILCLLHKMSLSTCFSGYLPDMVSSHHQQFCVLQ